MPGRAQRTLEHLPGAARWAPTSEDILTTEPEPTPPAADATPPVGRAPGTPPPPAGPPPGAKAGTKEGAQAGAKAGPRPPGASAKADPPAPDDAEPGFFEATRQVRTGVMDLVQAHIDLLKAELASSGRQLGVIVAMALGILVLAILTGLLIVIGMCLFLGEWLFGSMGWGILHGSLFFIALAVPLGLDLAGGWRGAVARGLAAGLIATVLLWVLFASNVLRDAAVRAGDAIAPSFGIEPAVWPTLVGAIVGALILMVVGGIVVARLRPRPRGRQLVGILVAFGALGAVVGAILGSVTFDTKGALAIALTIGYLVWIATMIALAAARGFDPEGRYAGLVPRESIAMAEETKTFLERQWRRQRRKVLGR